MLDKREKVLENLELIKKSYVQLVLFKQLEQECYEKDDYASLYEFSENERVVIDDINTIMRYIVPDLVYLKDDCEVSKKLSEIDHYQSHVIRECIKLRGELELGIHQTRKKLENLSGLSRGSRLSVPHIVNLRA